MLARHHCQQVFAIFWTRQSRPSPFCLVLTPSRLWRQLHVVGSVMHERPSPQQMAKWRNLPGVVHWGLHVVLPRGWWYLGRFLFSFLVTFVLLSSSRVCLLDVSRLLGLTLRPSAPVCSCHWDSLTCWRLALAQKKKYHDRLGDTLQRKDVHSRQWRFFAHDGTIFSESKREGGYPTVKQSSGYSARQRHSCLRHASKGLHKRGWRWSVGISSERVAVSAVVVKTLQWIWLFLFVAVRRNSQNIER